MADGLTALQHGDAVVSETAEAEQPPRVVQRAPRRVRSGGSSADDRHHRAAGRRHARDRTRAPGEPEALDLPHLSRHAFFRRQDAVQDARRRQLPAARACERRGRGAVLSRVARGRVGRRRDVRAAIRRNCTRSASRSRPTSADSVPSSKRRRSSARWTAAWRANSLQRIPRGFPKDHDAAEYLKYRQFLAGREFPARFATGSDVLQRRARCLSRRSRRSSVFSTSPSRDDSKNHLRDDERRSDGGAASRARSRDRGRARVVRQELPARGRRPRRSRRGRVRRSQPNRHANSARQVSEREPGAGSRSRLPLHVRRFRRGARARGPRASRC